MDKNRLYSSIAIISAFCLNTILFLNTGSYPHLLFLPGIFAILVCLAWFSIGMGGGIILLGLSLIFISLSWIASGGFNLNLTLLPFLVLGIFLSWVTNKMRYFKNIVTIELDRTEGVKNTLIIQHKKDQLLTSALEKKLKRYLALKGIAEGLSPLLSLDEIADIAARECWTFFDESDACLLYLVDEEHQTLKLIKERLKEKDTRIKAKQGDAFDDWVLKHAQTLYVPDVSKDFRFSEENFKALQHPLKSLIAAPLMSHQKMLGILRMDSRTTNIYNVDDLRLLNIVADLIAVAVFNSFLYQRVQELAITDGLTGLYLHRYFYQRLEEELMRAIEGGTRLSLVIMDIDNFKQYNDKFGHTAGDLVLKWLARILKGTTADSGYIIARYGGEEFALIIPESSKELSISFAEYIRACVEKESFILRREETRITVSIGISHFPDDARRRGDSIHMKKEDLVQIADERLYKAKSEGKNRVCAGF